MTLLVLSPLKDPPFQVPRVLVRRKLLRGVREEINGVVGPGAEDDSEVGPGV